MQTIYSNLARTFSVFMLVGTAALVAGLAGCGASGSKNTNAATSATTIALTATPPTIKSDGTTSTTITATVLASGNTVLPGQTLSFTTSTGQLVAASGVTDANGSMTATLSAGASGINRTAIVTATSGTASNQIPVQIVGSTVTANATTTNLVENAGTVTVTFKALNASNNPVAGTPIAVTSTTTGTTNVTITPVSGYTTVTDASGEFKVTVAGPTGSAGTATVTAAALGTSGSSIFTISAANTFSISGLTLNTTALLPANTNAFSTASMRLGQTLTVFVTAPSAATVQFHAGQGTWDISGNSDQLVTTPGSGIAQATLSTTKAGMADIQVYDPANPTTASDSLRVAMTATTPASITLQASPSVVSKGATGTSTLTATVVDANGAPVGDAAVGFTVFNPTGGGEIVSPSVAFTSSAIGATLGQASTSFTAGSSPTSAKGVSIRASVLGTTVTTGTAPSGNDATIVIGGSPSSVAFGQATVLDKNSNGSQYILAMSVVVTDANGNPAPQGTVVNLSLWPIAWSTGGGCLYDADTPTTGTFYNEDLNENTILEAPPKVAVNEDGYRVHYADNLLVQHTGGRIDGMLTPANSVAGSIPATVTTDANGIANFNLTYPISSAIWVVDRIQGKTIVQGTAAVGETTTRLGALISDVTPCKIPDSPFLF